MSRPPETDRRANGADHAGDPAGGDGASLTGERLVLRYPDGEEPVVDDETVVAEPGAVTALVGPNGSGKSTLLAGLADQLDREAGSVLVDGRAADSLDRRALARRLGLLSQERTAPDGATVETLVHHGRYPHRGFFDAVSEADERAVDRALELAGCEHLRDRELRNLSGGQRQLAWIAMVLAQETDVLLLDEPTTFLDLRHQLEVLEVIETLRDDGDTTVVVVLHDVEQAARLADRVVALKNGEVRARGPPEAVVTERLLAEVFGVDAEVERTPRGPRVEPLEPRHDGPDADR